MSPCANTCDNVGVEGELPLDAPVTCPFASTVTVALVYEPAVTPELSCVIVTDPLEPPPPIGEVVDTFVISPLLFVKGKLPIVESNTFELELLLTKITSLVLNVPVADDGADKIILSEPV